jgi:hypothetical protein
MVQKPKLGDHLVSPRRLYRHHGLYAGRGMVIHYAGLANGLQAGPVKISTLEDFLSGAPYEIREHRKRAFTRRESVARARARLGEDLYNVTFNNCEHFVEWCITGKSKSRQIDLLLGAVGGVPGFLIGRGGAKLYAASKGRKKKPQGSRRPTASKEPGESA